ncbi:MAG: DUF1674 domain-containing protein [Robiginitomaculum sp.]|nr:DUF1674 domain-containing protein [Robiginitomaculum sp.]
MAKSKQEIINERRKQAAKRALAEAEQRRSVAKQSQALPIEHNSRRKIEPTRYGDWERSGITSDF